MIAAIITYYGTVVTQRNATDQKNTIIDCPRQFS